MVSMPATSLRDRLTWADLEAMGADGRTCELVHGSIYISPRDPGARFTRPDLDSMPDDGRKYELLTGTIVVSPPSPGREHQRAVPRLWQLLDNHAPEGLEVYLAPFDVALSAQDVVQPDVMVVQAATVSRRGVEGAPLLVVEVLSPATHDRDLGEKSRAYRDAGVPSYWVVDPVDPRLRVWTLRDGEYVEVADVSGDEEWTSDAPYAVTVRPSDLTR